MKDPWYKATGLTLKDWGFNLRDQSEPDAKHFGNWILIATGHNLALRIIRDRGRVNLDLMPVIQFTQDAPESDWFNWDVVARALAIPLKPEIESLVSFHDYFQKVNDAFAPENWERTKSWLVHIEEEKRRRFTEGRRSPVYS